MQKMVHATSKDYESEATKATTIHLHAKMYHAGEKKIKIKSLLRA